MRKRQHSNVNKDVPLNPWKFISFIAFVAAVFFLSAKGTLYQDKQPPIDAAAAAAISFTDHDSNAIPLDRGAPVGTLRMNGKTYVIWTTNENDRPQ